MCTRMESTCIPTNLAILNSSLSYHRVFHKPTSRAGFPHVYTLMMIDPQNEPKKRRLVLIDGHSLVYRAFFALPSLTDREGRVVNAAYGFTSMLLLALQEHPDYVLASFDLGGRTFRHEELAQYKATRRPTPPELSPQFPLTRDIVRAFGIPIYEIQGVEADDVIGTLARQAREQGLHSTIVTGDLDALQLVNDDVDVLTSKRGVSETILYTPDRVRQRYGLEPIQTVDLKGLVGDVSDNIPGIRGIGEKTAIRLIQEFGSVESLVENRERVAPPKIKKLIDEHWEQALLSKKMATIVLDVGGVTLDLSHGSARDYRPAAARTILSDLGFRSLAARVPTTWTDGSAMSAPPIFAPPPRKRGQLAHWDLLIAADLLNSGVRSPSLEALASDVLHRSIEGREALLGSGKAAMSCDQVDIMRDAAFFGERMRVMLELPPTPAAELERLGNAELFRDLEMPLLPVLAEMELAGVSIDLPYLQQVSRELY